MLPTAYFRSTSTCCDSTQKECKALAKQANEIIERNELLKMVKRRGRAIWKKWSGYHRRSLVETQVHCIKLLADKLSAKNFDSQVNEIHARVSVLNKFTELGRPHTQVVT
ncbi:Transposase IS4-like domain-containing protein [Acinetobacter pragensis]